MRRLLPLAVSGLLAALSAGCATTGASPAPFPRPSAGRATTPSAGPGGAPSGSPVAGAAAAGSPVALGYGITGTALGLRGAPYKNGGSDPSGFDCSGFVTYVFGQSGIPLPRTVGELYRAGQDVTGAIAPGDLVFFSTIAPGASHVGIAIGGDEFVHAPSTSGQVRVERLGAPYWSTRFVGARRVL